MLILNMFNTILRSGFSECKQVKTLTCGDWALRFSPSGKYTKTIEKQSKIFLSLMAAITH